MSEQLYPRLAREYWVTEPPTKPGWYWIYAIPEYENKPEIYFVDVFIHEGEPHFSFPIDGYEYDIHISPHRTTHWLGPIPEPEPPV